MTTARPSRREQHAADTRRAILLAAQELFTEHGYAATRIADIAERARVSVQTIYDSVGSKGRIVAGLNDLLDNETDIGSLAPLITSAATPGMRWLPAYAPRRASMRLARPSCAP